MEEGEQKGPATQPGMWEGQVRARYGHALKSQEIHINGSGPIQPRRDPPLAALPILPQLKKPPGIVGRRIEEDLVQIRPPQRVSIGWQLMNPTLLKANQSQGNKMLPGASEVGSANSLVGPQGHEHPARHLIPRPRFNPAQNLWGTRCTLRRFPLSLIVVRARASSPEKEPG